MQVIINFKIFIIRYYENTNCNSMKEKKQLDSVQFERAKYYGKQDRCVTGPTIHTLAILAHKHFLAKSKGNLMKTSAITTIGSIYAALSNSVYLIDHLSVLLMGRATYVDQ